MSPQTTNLWANLGPLLNNNLEFPNNTKLEIISGKNKVHSIGGLIEFHCAGRKLSSKTLWHSDIYH